MLTAHPVLFIECLNDDPETLDLSVARKARLPEFSHLSQGEAVASFWERISYYRRIRTPLGQERNYILLDSLNHRIVEERISDVLPFYERIRDLLVTDSIKNLYLVRHGETSFNLEQRIGGDSGLTDRGWEQARALAEHFRDVHLPYVFTSRKFRTAQTAQPIIRGRTDCSVIPLAEFDEIDAGVCENMTYEEIRRVMPEVFARRSEDKYNYVYPDGEGYATLRERVDRGLKKALFLSGNSEHILIVGHQAVNRTILSHFLYRRPEDMPYIYIPQDRYYHIVSTQNQKLFELKPYR
jgi:broad specificity phosphatase PhoE